MEKFEDVGIPNTDFKNKAGLVSLSFQKQKGGFFLRENISGEKFIVGGFGQLAQILSGLASELTNVARNVNDQCKDGEVFTVEIQVRKGLTLMFNMAAGSGLLAIDNVGGWRPQNVFGQMMQSIALAVGLAPEFLSQFPQSHDGWITFTSHPSVANNPNFNKNIVSNFNPFGNMQGMGFSPSGLDGDAFAFVPTINVNGTKNPNVEISVKETRKPSGEISLS